MIGYTAGVWDMFHVGHLRMLKRVRGMCDFMIVGVSTDELVMDIKDRIPTINFEDRMEIIDGLGWVDSVIPQHTYDKHLAWQKLKFDVLFIGDDHYGEKKWKSYERKLKKEGVDIIYLPYTHRISSTMLREYDTL